MAAGQKIDKAIVLVGGFGTRLRPLTLSRPKQMLPILGQPMIELVLSSLISAGIKEAVLSMGYKPDMFLEHYPDSSYSGVKLTYCIESEPLGTAGAIAYAAREASLEGTFLAVNGDILHSAPIDKILDRHFESEALATILLTAVDDPSRYGVVQTEGSRAVSFNEKPSDLGDMPVNQINAGIYVLEPEILQDIPPNKKMSIEREIFPSLAKKGKLHTFFSDEYWIDAGTPESYLQVQMDMLSQNPELGKEVACVQNPGVQNPGTQGSVLMSDATAEEGSELHNSVLLPGAFVESGAVVKDSIIGHNAKVRKGASVTDMCIIGDDMEVSAGSNLKSARVPE